MAKKIFMLLSLVSVLALSSCGSKHEEKEETAKYLVTSPVQQDTLVERKYVCQIHSVKHIELRALEQGYLQKIFVDEGQTVVQGQKMFQIMPNVYQAELSKAKAEAEKAERLPDLEKISLYTDELLKVPIPQLKNETAGEILATFKNELKLSIDKALTAVKKLS